MKRLSVSIGLLACGWAAFGQNGAIPDSEHLKNVQRLTNGGQNAEAYWSPDGKRLVFQSTRDPYQCDQIFLMNADGSDQRLISTGKGRTTCAYFLKDNKSIVYGSTHEGAPECPAPPDRSKGYLWAVFPTFDIFLTDDSGKAPVRLTDSNGYDAEATVNFKTGKVLYTSLASGDLELWRMNGNGSAKKQITNRVGYDGGAFFSHDGKKIVWRATAPDNEKVMARYKELIKENLTEPMRMELFLADANGKNVKQLTNFGCASFAPSFTPDDKRIVFASNKHNCDGRKFELFMINTDGTGLKQITNFGGFVSFPEFSPDGRKLVFSSDYGAKSRYEFNIFVADWQD
jgi:Tol biopolymer transport system component